MTRADRRDLGWLGLMLLLFGLVLAPLLHREGHDHAHHHGSDVPADVPHGAGSVEHLDALVRLAPALAAPRFVPIETAAAPIVTRENPLLVARLTVAQPQGP
ncbi:MAG: hypothetical protein MUC96_29160 [Myxococcaceae bacterium]|nr:hypothetical protein [Myxococcaceae bacterium]